mmetsp:Transcript_19415/g.46792  ORF Transcript_19415/g.46792 Transcript_19415/m.46792 type:complete len:181 (-) Transcript_19415:110-652(-)
MSPTPGKVFVGGLSKESGKDSLDAYFGQYGNIVDSVVMRDGGGTSRGFGFVTFEDPSCVDAVFEVGVRHEVDGKSVEVKRATPEGSKGAPASKGGGGGGGGPPMGMGMGMPPKGMGKGKGHYAPAFAYPAYDPYAYGGYSPYALPADPYARDPYNRYDPYARAPGASAYGGYGGPRSRPY